MIHKMLEPHERLPVSWEFLFDENTMDIILIFQSRLLKIEFSPRPCLILRPLYEVKFYDVKVVIMGQSPYRNRKYATGHAFSVEKKNGITPSLSTIFKELKLEYPDFVIPDPPSLNKWVNNGILLLNSSLTTPTGEYIDTNHYAFWYPFIKNIIKSLSSKGRVVFIFWGKKARRFSEFVDRSSNLVLESVFPIKNTEDGFLGCNHFRLASEYLNYTINWKLS